MLALQHNPISAQYFPQDILQKIRTIYATAFNEDIKVLIGVSVVGIIASIFSHESDPPPMPGHMVPKSSLSDVLHRSETELNDLTRYH